MRKLLITGVAGFIGSHIADQALAAGWQVEGIDDFSIGTRRNIANALSNGLHVHTGDVESQLRFVRSADVIIHCAARLGVELIAEEPLPMLTEHPRDAIAVCELARHTHATLVMVSSSEVYGSDLKPLSETSSIRVMSSLSRRSGYAVTKLLCEHLALRYSEEFGVPVVVPRLFNVAGPRQHARHGVVARFVDWAMTGQPLVVYPGTRLRAFAHVHDVAGALLKLSTTPYAYGQIVNVGCRHTVQIMDLAQRVATRCGKFRQRVHISQPAVVDDNHCLVNEMQDRIPDVLRLICLLGAELPDRLNDIITDTVADWLQKQAESEWNQAKQSQSAP